MQLLLNGVDYEGGSLIIKVAEGRASWSIPVVRNTHGEYQCFGLQCIHKKTQAFCEHVQFAREQHDTVIAPTEKFKAEEKLKLALANLEQARALVSSIESQLPATGAEPILSGPRRIVLENE